MSLKWLAFIWYVDAWEWFGVVLCGHGLLSYHCILSSIDHAVRYFFICFFTPRVVIRKNKVRFKVI